MLCAPASFSCPGGVGAGRWLWKNANQCNDANNVARKTETFDMGEYTDVVRAYDPSGRVLGVCGSAVEIFVSCFDFKIAGSSSPSPAPAPTQAPAPPTQAPAPPTQAPTQAPTTQAPAPAPVGPGLCCYGGCGGGNCQGGWCGESQ